MPSFVIVRISTRIRGNRVVHGVSGESKYVEYVPMIMRIDMPRKYKFASLRNCSNKDL
jgi:hypothetical protein